MRSILSRLVLVLVGGTLADEKALDKSLAQMFRAYRGSPLSSPDLKMLLRSSFDDVNHHDDDGHVQGRDHGHEQGDFNLYHDGPGGHHHDDDGHLHHKAQEDDGVSQDKGLKSKEGTKKQDSLSDITLTIAKLLFHLSQA